MFTFILKFSEEEEQIKETIYNDKLLRSSLALQEFSILMVNRIVIWDKFFKENFMIIYDKKGIVTQKAATIVDGTCGNIELSYEIVRKVQVTKEASP